MKDDGAAPPEAGAGSTPRLRPRGSNQTGMRQFNERVVLQAIRLHGALPQAALARLTHLTAQTVSLIIARLVADGLLLRMAPLRGKVGQPSVPIALNPDGAFSIGLTIGRRSMDALLVDFAGGVRERVAFDYDFPDPDVLFSEIDARLRALRQGLKPGLRERLHGIGVAAPLSIGGWQQLLGFAPGLAEKWHGTDIRERVARLGAARELPVEFVKDTAAGCVAELVVGRGRSVRSFLYVFIDTFIGGGLVLDSHLHGGLHGNAGAVGSMSTGLAGVAQSSLAPSLSSSSSASALPSAHPAAREQVLGTASLWNLEAIYAGAGLAVDAWVDERALSGPWWPLTQAWLQVASPAIALAIVNTACLLDLGAVIVDGSFGRGLLAALTAELETALDGYSWEGVARPTVVPGTVGPDARAIGGALLPLYANFAPDRELFLKPEP